jgi:predicted DNA-binding antitoxin AbrB/MazE fold protein
MTQRVQAIYENGVFRPLTPVAIEDRGLVMLAIEVAAAQAADDQLLLRQREALAALRAEMEAMPVAAPADGFSGADHDRLLYGTP